MRAPPVIWRFIDGKPGHESQTAGLAAAIQRQMPVHVYSIDVRDCRCGVASLLRRRHPCRNEFPPPDLILACGRTTHFAALAARRACGGKLISLMNPPFPASFYDLCLVPQHDRVPTGPNVITTRGVLNPIVAAPMNAERQGRGLVLIGGPSTHHWWNGSALISQLVEVMMAAGHIQWTLTTSRRTPPSFLTELEQKLPTANSSRLTIVPVDATPRGWVAEQLAKSDRALVTEDSVSMIYESLTAGVAVGVLTMPRRRNSRVCRGVNQLLKDGLTVPATEIAAKTISLNPPALQEADRCAEAILNRWFDQCRRAA
jgi:uncharacterized protein